MSRTILDELLEDPMVRMVMARDRVDAGSFRAMIVSKVDGQGRERAMPANVPAAHIIDKFCSLRAGCKAL